MRIAVIGAGIVGVTTALELVSHGHEVVVFEKNTGIAQEASFATSGFIGPGLIHSWTVPQMALKVIQKMIFGSDAYSYHGLKNIPLKWLWQWSSACTHADFKLKIESLQRLAFYSQEVMKGISEQYGFQFELSKGSILICRQEKEMKRFQLQLDLMTANGIAFKKLDPKETRILEPALSEEIQFLAQSFSQMMKLLTVDNSLYWRSNKLPSWVPNSEQGKKFYLYLQHQLGKFKYPINPKKTLTI